MVPRESLKKGVIVFMYLMRLNTSRNSAEYQFLKKAQNRTASKKVRITIDIFVFFT